MQNVPPRPVRVAADRILRSAAGPALLIACLAAVELSPSDAAANRALFESRAAAVGASLAERIAGRARTLANLGGLFSAGEDPDWRTFAGVPGAGGSGHTSTEIFAWAPRIAAHDRDNYEQATGRNAQRSFAVREVDGIGAFVPVGVRAEHLPLHLIHPLASGTRLLGLDMLAHEGLRPALDRSRDTGLAEIIGPIALPASDAFASFSAIVIARPVFRGVAPPATVERRRRELRGYLVATVDFDVVVARSVGGSAPTAGDALEIRVQRPDAGGGASAGGERTPPDVTILRPLAALSWQGVLELDGGAFEVRLRPMARPARLARRDF